MGRRSFLQRSSAVGGGLVASGGFSALAARTAQGQERPETAGYGPLVPKPPVGGTEGADNILALPAEFNYQVIDRQGLLQRDGNLTPGIFDAMGAFPDVGPTDSGSGHRTILIRNHEKRERPGEIPVTSDTPVEAVPIRAAGRFVHEATAWRAGILYQTEDRSLQADPLRGTIGACFYRYVLDPRVGQSGNLAETTGVLQAAMVRGVPTFNFDAVTTPGASFPIEWVTVEDPDHADDTDNRRDRVRGFTPTRIQAQDKGAA
ncbi:MAG TPA: alkaline phosphatase PhoX, partial [Solirubrobacteraceae bacterium]|nr:alkaline phosphatase PhoX [Solirubrobacteraceae bacterium]